MDEPVSVLLVGHRQLHVSATHTCRVTYNNSDKISLDQPFRLALSSMTLISTLRRQYPQRAARDVDIDRTE